MVPRDHLLEEGHSDWSAAAHVGDQAGGGGEHKLPVSGVQNKRGEGGVYVGVR